MPQPIDLQTEMSRVNAAERVQQITERASQLAQQRATALQQHEQVQGESQVQKSRPSDERTGVDPEAKEKEKEQKRGRGRQGTPTARKTRTFYTSEERPEVVEDPEEHHLDLQA